MVYNLFELLKKVSSSGKIHTPDKPIDENKWVYIVLVCIGIHSLLTNMKLQSSFSDSFRNICAGL